MTRFKDYFGFEINCDLVTAWVFSSREELQVGGGSVESSCLGFQHTGFDMPMTQSTLWICIIHAPMAPALWTSVSSSLTCPSLMGLLFTPLLGLLLLIFPISVNGAAIYLGAPAENLGISTGFLPLSLTSNLSEAQTALSSKSIYSPTTSFHYPFCDHPSSSCLCTTASVSY